MGRRKKYYMKISIKKKNLLNILFIFTREENL